MARGHGRGTGRRTDYSWSGTGDVLLAVDIGAVAQFLGTAGTFTQPGTVMRLRGQVGATLDTGAVDEIGMILFGIVIVSSDAFTAGAAPEFQTDGATSEEGRWIWTGSIFLSSGAEAAVVTDQLSDTLEIDSKAMRRVKPNDVLAMVVQAPAALWTDQAGTIDVVARWRTLLGV